MIEEKTEVPNRYQIVGKDGQVVTYNDGYPATFATVTEAAAVAKRRWPDEEQDETRSGKGWDIQVVSPHLGGIDGKPE